MLLLLLLSLVFLLLLLLLATVSPPLLSAMYPTLTSGTEKGGSSCYYPLMAKRRINHNYRISSKGIQPSYQLNQHGWKKQAELSSRGYYRLFHRSSFYLIRPCRSRGCWRCPAASPWTGCAPPRASCGVAGRARSPSLW